MRSMQVPAAKTHSGGILSNAIANHIRCAERVSCRRSSRGRDGGPL